MGHKVTLIYPFPTHAFTHVPSITPLPSGKFRAQVAVLGERDSKSFRTKREAQAWGAAREAEIRSRKGKQPGEIHTLGDLLQNFSEKVSPKRPGCRWEQIRITAFETMLPIGTLVGNMGIEEMQSFRDKRLREVKPGTVLRDISLLSSIFEHAKQELKWISINPVHEIKKPPSPKHRKVLITREQIRKLLSAMGYSPRGRVATVSAAVGISMMLALRTGMRAGEVCGLRWADVTDDSGHVSEKTPAGDRDVPLTPKAMRLIEKMHGYDPEYVVGIGANSLDAMFRKYRKRAGLEGFTFHDTRHTAATWMVANGSLNVLELCKVFGWTDPKMAMVYFNPSSKELIKRMTTKRPSTPDQSPRSE